MRLCLFADPNMIPGAPTKGWKLSLKKKVPLIIIGNLIRPATVFWPYVTHVTERVIVWTSPDVTHLWIPGWTPSVIYLLPEGGVMWKIISGSVCWNLCLYNKENEFRVRHNLGRNNSFLSVFLFQSRPSNETVDHLHFTCICSKNTDPISCKTLFIVSNEFNMQVKVTVCDIDLLV